MLGKSDITGFNPADGIEVRTYLEALRARVESDRASWEKTWQQLTSFFAPYQTKSVDQTNNGARRDLRIINETGLLALRTLGAGMLTGMSNPTRAWLKIRPADTDLDDIPKDALSWCEDTEDAIYRVFLKSNVYQSLLNLYTEEGLYGTSALILEEDPETTIRCHPLTIGNYSLIMDDRLRICGLVRQVSMTVDQLVTRFGAENVSDSTLVQWTSNAGGTRETRRTVVHVLLRGDYLGGKLSRFPYQSIWYELDSYEKTGLLRRSGFFENPLICGRWKVTGEDVYGRSAGMDCLGSVMSLQAYEERLAQAAEKGYNPPMIFGTHIDMRKNVLLPGDFVFADTDDVSKAAQPAYQINFKLADGISMLQRIEARINDAMYRSLFQMFSESDRREITAEEIRARQQEKMQVLGPVVERNVEEVLAPLVKRTLAILERRGQLKPLPQSLKNSALNLEFVSILAQAQKIGRITNIQTFMGIVGQEVAVDQGILDNVDMDELVKEAADLTDVSSKLTRSPEDVAKLRADRQQQQMQQQQAENAKNLAVAAQNLSNAKLDQGSALDAVMPSLASMQ